MKVRPILPLVVVVVGLLASALAPGTASVLNVGGSVCVGTAFPRTSEMLAARGYDVRAVEVSEFAKAEGGLTCTCLLFKQA